VLSHATRWLKLPHSIWQDLAVDSSLLFLRNSPVIPDKNKNNPAYRLSYVGDIGTTDSPIYMPFITVNSSQILGSILDAADVIIGGDGKYYKLYRKTAYPYLYGTAVLATAINCSTCGEDSTPILSLSKTLEVNENRRRRLGV
jgi:hypothetical protein